MFQYWGIVKFLMAEVVQNDVAHAISCSSAYDQI